MSKAELAAAREALSRLKFHPRDALPNATALARADALFVELVGEARAMLGAALSEFRHALDAQDTERITKARDQLEHLMRALR